MDDKDKKDLSDLADFLDDRELQINMDDGISINRVGSFDCIMAFDSGYIYGELIRKLIPPNLIANGIADRINELEGGGYLICKILVNNEDVSRVQEALPNYFVATSYSLPVDGFIIVTQKSFRG